MANRNEHLLWGGIAGAGACLATAIIRKQNPSLLEFIGAVLSGIAAACLPDWLEPATHPNHRAFFHSVAFAGTALPPLWIALANSRDGQLRNAAWCEQSAATAQNAQDAQYWRDQAGWHRLLAGISIGIAPGYASHLAADALTPKRLPFL